MTRSDLTVVCLPRKADDQVMETTTAQQKPSVTDRAFVRSHGTSPRGRGTWAFQKSTSMDAFAGHLVGDVLFVPFATLTEAKAEAVAHFTGDAWCVAVLP